MIQFSDTNWHMATQEAQHSLFSGTAKQDWSDGLISYGDLFYALHKCDGFWRNKHTWEPPLWMAWLKGCVPKAEAFFLPGNKGGYDKNIKVYMKNKTKKLKTSDGQYTYWFPDKQK